jgi:hypothetical protein
MAILVKDNLTTDLALAFAKDSWAATATQFTDAITAYVQTASVIEIAIAGAWTAFPNTAGSALGICTATITDIATLPAACTIAFALNLWDGVASLISTAISKVLTTSTVALTSYATIPDPLPDPPPTYTLGGVGVANAANAAITVTPADTVTLTTKINAAFTTGTVWATVANDIATAVDDFIKTAKVTTLPSPSGSLPVPWTGLGGDIGGFK